MNAFITFIDEGEYYVCQRDFPHYIGIVQTQALGFIPVSLIGYSLFLNFKGTLSGNRITSDLVEAKQVMVAMARWYEANLSEGKFGNYIRVRPRMLNKK